MSTPVSLNHGWINFDGIVERLVYRRVLGRDFYNLDGSMNMPDVKRGMWLGVLAHTDDIAHASVSIFDNDSLATEEYYKCTHLTDIPGTSKLNIVGGHFRRANLRVIYVCAEYVRFQVLGNLPRLIELLGDLTHIGGDSRIGFGRISNMVVRSIPYDLSLVDGGIAQRPLPVRMLATSSEQLMLSCRAPYWRQDNMEMCAPPGALVCLRETHAEEVVWFGAIDRL